MKASTKLILSAILLPSFVAVGYGGYVYFYEKPKVIKKILELLKKRFEQTEKSDKFTALDWQLLLSKIDPNTLKRMKTALEVMVGNAEKQNNSEEVASQDLNVEASKYKEFVSKLKKTLEGKEVLVLIEKNNILPNELNLKS